MNNQRYSPEFKDKAVRQVVVRGHSVAEVSDRLGVSAHSLYQWVDAVKPAKSDEKTQELIEAKSEIRGYIDEDGLARIDPATLSGMEPEEQTQIMLRWFYENFEDPAERTPYQSSEGGYIWIYGGPYDARQELEDQFEGSVPEDVIEELADELEGDSPEWAPALRADDYDRYIVDDIIAISGHCGKFRESISDVDTLLDTDVEDSVKPVFYRMLFANVITAMETYLSDVFIGTVMNDDSLTQKFVESTPVFQQEKIRLSDIYKEMEEINGRAASHLTKIVWHNLSRVAPMYRDTLGIRFPDEIGDIYRAILTRHDIVHRNGMTKDGVETLITKEEVEDLDRMVADFIDQIDERVGALAVNEVDEESADF